MNENVKNFLIYYTLYRICGQVCSLIGIPGLYPNVISGLCLILFCRSFLEADNMERLKVRRGLMLFTITFFILTQSISICLSYFFHDTNPVFNSAAVQSTLLVKITAIGFISPAAEEILFRRFLFQGLKPVGKTKSAVISSIIFGLCHRNMVLFVYAALWGMVFCFVYEKYQNLKAPVAIHMISNVLSLCLQFIGP